MLWILILITTVSQTLAQRKFGLFKMDYESVSQPYPKTDIVDYRILLSRVNKTYKDFSGWFKFNRKAINIQLELLMLKKMAAGGYQTYIRKPAYSFCAKTNFPVFRDRFSAKIVPEDCSIDQGYYTLKSYSVEEELRNYVGDKTFYGDYTLCLRWLEEEDYNTTLFGFNINYIVKEAELAKTNGNAKEAPYRKEKKQNDS